MLDSKVDWLLHVHDDVFAISAANCVAHSQGNQVMANLIRTTGQVPGP